MLRRLGGGQPAAAPVPDRARVRLRRLPRRRRHDRPARRGSPRRSAEQLGLSPRRARRRWPGAYERWDGRGWPGGRGRRGHPPRLPHQPARRVRRGRPPHRRHGRGARPGRRRARAPSSIPRSCACLLRRPPRDLRRPRRGRAPGTAVIAAEPALDVVLSGDEVDAALLAIADFVDLKSPYTLGHSRAVAELAASAGATARPRRRAEVRTLRRAGFVHDFGRLGVSNSIWDKRGPLGAGEWERVRMHPYYHGADARAVGVAGAARPHRRAAPERMDGSGYPRGLAGQRHLAPGPHPRRRRRLPGHARAPSPPRPPARPTRRPRSCAPRSAPGASTRTPSTPCSRRPGHRVPRRRDGPAGLDRPGGRGARPAWPAGCRTSRSPSAS